MSGRKGILRGKRFRSQHSTVTEPAARVLQLLRPMESVRRAIIGEIRPVKRRSTDIRVKIVEMPSGLRLSVTGGRAVQHVYIYTDEPDLVRAALADFV